MLYTQCARCFTIGPLMCGGQMFPHVPMAMVPTPMGPGCPGCGSVMQIFTCTSCCTTQYLLQPGVAPQQARQSAFGGAPAYAPVVQASQGASSHTVRGLFEDLTKVAVREATGAAMDYAFQRFNG